MTDKEYCCVSCGRMQVYEPVDSKHVRCSFCGTIINWDAVELIEELRNELRDCGYNQP